MKSYLRWICLALLLALGIPALAQDEGSGWPLAYSGRHDETDWPQLARAQIQPLLPRAVARAESLLGLPLDRARVNYLIVDLLPGQKGRTQRMVTMGGEIPLVGIYLEPLIRGDYAGPEDVLTTLTHETIHALVRQRLPQVVYAGLPEWFQEGVAVHLCGQGTQKLTDELAFFWADTDTLLSACVGEHRDLPYVTGCYFFAELAARTGHQGVQAFVQEVIVNQSLAAALATLPVSEAELWDGTRRRLAADIETVAGQVAPRLAECLRLYEQGRRTRVEAMACLAYLIKEFPDTYAAEYAHFWYAKCAYHRGQHDLAREYFATFLSFAQDYGLREDVSYYRFLMDTRDGIKQHLALFPEGQGRDKIQAIRDVLRGQPRAEN